MFTPFSNPLDIAISNLVYFSPQLEEKQYPPYIKELVELEVKGWCRSDNISPNIIKLVTELWLKNPRGNFPKLDDLVDYFNTRSCLCIRSYTQEERKELIKHFLSNFGRLPACIETDTAMEFYRLEHRLPLPEELETTLQRTMQLMSDPEAFHATDKLHIPVPNLAHMQAVPMEDTADSPHCALCMEDIKTGQNCYRLSCTHIFHADPLQCLEECSIIEWFKGHRQCPVCRAEIRVSPRTVDDSQEHKTT